MNDEFGFSRKKAQEAQRGFRVCDGEFFSRKEAQKTQRGFLLGRRGSDIRRSGAVWYFGLELQTNTPTALWRSHCERRRKSEILFALFAPFCG
ncbi:MAG TPA: hypothetical protein VFT72_04545 [Opitutaceae bacterium]|nr:hypothetical protein [Opitutaceae bacterium]